MVPGVGPRIRQQLLEHFGSAEAVLSASSSELRFRSSNRVLARSFARRSCELAVRLMRKRRSTLPGNMGIEIVLEIERTVSAAAPRFAGPAGRAVRSRRCCMDRAIAFAIGAASRHATHYGLQQAERLAGERHSAGNHGRQRAGPRDRCRGASSGTLRAGGRTHPGVLASGVLNVYPPEHKEPGRESRGLRCWSSANRRRWAEPLSGMFPQRNRIISGLSLGVLVNPKPPRVPAR